MAPACDAGRAGPLGSGQAVRRLILDQEIEGSNPSSPATCQTPSCDSAGGYRRVPRSVSGVPEASGASAACRPAGGRPAQRCLDQHDAGPTGHVEPVAQVEADRVKKAVGAGVEKKQSAQSQPGRNESGTPQPPTAVGVTSTLVSWNSPNRSPSIMTSPPSPSETAGLPRSPASPAAAASSSDPTAVGGTSPGRRVATPAVVSWAAPSDRTTPREVSPRPSAEPEDRLSRRTANDLARRAEPKGVGSARARDPLAREVKLLGALLGQIIIEQVGAQSFSSWSPECCGTGSQIRDRSATHR